MKNQEKLSHMMLFCGLMLVQRDKATIRELSERLPMEGRSRALAQALANRSLEMNLTAGQPAGSKETGNDDPRE